MFTSLGSTRNFHRKDATAEAARQIGTLECTETLLSFRHIALELFTPRLRRRTVSDCLCSLTGILKGTNTGQMLYFHRRNIVEQSRFNSFSQFRSIGRSAMSLPTCRHFASRFGRAPGLRSPRPGAGGGELAKCTMSTSQTLWAHEGLQVCGTSVGPLLGPFPFFVGGPRTPLLPRGGHRGGGRGLSSERERERERERARERELRERERES